VKTYLTDVKQISSVQLEIVQCISSTTCEGRKFVRMGAGVGVRSLITVCKSSVFVRCCLALLNSIMLLNMESRKLSNLPENPTKL
jgi:hypothetical protein